jgi:hypothetical protein
MQDKDILSELRASIHYYEHLADKKFEERQVNLARMALKLKKVLTKIENVIECKSCC